jgi:hypothetical protein
LLYAPENLIFFLPGVFIEDNDPRFDLSEILVERRVWEPTSSTRGFVLTGSMGGEVSRSPLQEESEDFEEDSTEGEDIGFLRVVLASRGTMTRWRGRVRAG